MGMNIEIDRNRRTLTIHQQDYVDRLLDKFGMSDCNGQATPMEQGLKLMRNENDEKADVPYRELIDSIMFLMLASRPDLCFSIAYLSRFQDNPSETHWNHLKRVVRYLKHTKDVKLVYRCDSESPLSGFVDADWANDRKSTSGYLFKVYGNIVCWSSKKQGLVAKSSSEAEYVAASEAASEAIWLIKILNDLHVNPNLQ